MRSSARRGLHSGCCGLSSHNLLHFQQYITFASSRATLQPAACRTYTLAGRKLQHVRPYSGSSCSLASPAVAPGAGSSCVPRGGGSARGSPLPCIAVPAICARRARRNPAALPLPLPHAPQCAPPDGASCLKTCDLNQQHYTAALSTQLNIVVTALLCLSHCEGWQQRV